MNETILLSIVTPTRGNLSAYWLEQLISIEGNVEFILVYPPGQKAQKFDDLRVKVIISPYKGEVMQRAVGLINASGTYTIALDDDDFLHPQVARLVVKYFESYPNSWCLRLCKKTINYQDTEMIKRAWDELPDLAKLAVIEPAPKPTLRRKLYADYEILEEVPISPLNNKFKLSSLLLYSKRTDQNGLHPENFNNKVWKTDITQKAITDLLNFTQVMGSITWIPFWNLDRLLGLFLQARMFQPGCIIGHRLWGEEQVRYIQRPSNIKREVRSMFAGDMLLALRFPQYGYLWNLFFYEMWIALKVFLKTRFKWIRGLFFRFLSTFANRGPA
ncbi:MAG: glycosyltransferase family A protein [Leptolyngbyaceae cyanobacterium MO_188.B28]|nr:glycosyltransferase family A protein [Leptolyngbyaceae cyanobacterium MO_188.B28]